MRAMRSVSLKLKPSTSYRVEKREKERQEVGNVQKWTKAGSFRRAQNMMLKQSFSQSHESLAVGDDPNTTSHKIITACSVNNIACQTNDFSHGDKAGRVASWAVNFNNLLKDPVGLGIFTDFLQREFSEENIIFWKACEQYRQLADDQQRKSQAQDIYSRHLSAKASDPVNVDSAARSYTEKFLDNPTAIMFDVAQQQIFQLMRQDSYARFLKSDLYKNKLMEEMAGKALIDPSQLDNQGDDKSDKKKGKGKENDEKRRRSFLPWKQHRKSIKSTSDPEVKKANKKGKEEKETNGNNNNNLNVTLSSGVSTTTSVSTSNNNVIGLKKVPGPGIDLSTMRKEVFHPKESQDGPESHFKFCRIVMPDGSTTVVCAKPGQTARAVLSKLCEKRSISLAAVDVFLLGTDRLLELNQDISVLGSKEIVIERRVLFRLDLPNSKSIGVKAKPNRSIRDVFKPILNKYGYRMDNIAVHLLGCQEFIDLDVVVSELDNKRAVIVNDVEQTDMSRQQAAQPLSARSLKAPLSSRSKGGQSGSRGGSLEEITNKIFEDLMRGKSQLAHGFDELGVLELDKAKAHKNEEARSLGLFGLLRRESWGTKDNSKGNKSKGKVTFALPRSESKKKSHAKEGEKLFEMLSGAQRLRLEEQRGVVVNTGDLPSFLRQDDNSQDENGAVEEVHLNNDENYPAGGNMFDDVAEISKAGFLEKKSKRRETFDYPGTPRLSTSTPRDARNSNALATPMSEKWKSHGDRSFSQDGIIPSPREAEAYFRMSPLIVDSKKKTVMQFVDDPFAIGNSRSMTQSLDESSFVKSDMAKSKLDSNLSSHFGAHAFRPVRLSSAPDTPAPVASPEKFSPESKKLRSSTDVKNSLVISTLPNKMSPVTRSSPSSSSISSSTTHRDSPTPCPPFTVSTSPQPVKSSSSPQQHITSPTRNTKRLSEDMLLHKLQQAKRERDSQVHDTEMAAQARLGLSHSSNQSPLQGMNSSSAKRRHSPMQASHEDFERQDLAQRALLSPRFDQRPQGRSSPQASGTPSVMDMSQRALLSPRLAESPRYRQTDPPPYQKRTPPSFTHAIMNNSSVAMLSTKYTGTMSNGTTSTSPHQRPVTLPFSQPSLLSPRSVSHQAFGREPTSPSQLSTPPPYSSISPSKSVYANDECDEETVTFV